MASNIQTVVSQMTSDTVSDQQPSVKTTKAKTVKTKVSKKVMTSNQVSTLTTSSSTMTSATTNTMEVVENTISSSELKQSSKSHTHVQNSNLNKSDPDETIPTTPSTPSDDDVAKIKISKKKSNSSSSTLVNGKKKSKKNKKLEAEKENISVCQFEEKMRNLSNKHHQTQSKSAEHNFSEPDLDYCSDISNDCSSGDISINCSNDIDKENECIFTSIRENPFILNSQTQENTTNNKLSFTNNKISNNNCNYTNQEKIYHSKNSTCMVIDNHPTGQDTSKSTQISNSTANITKTKSSSDSSVQLASSPRRPPLEDVLANIDVKQLKTIYLAADASSHSTVKSQNSSTNKPEGQGRSIAIKNLKSSFSKFDALQKRNLIHVRSSDAGKAQEKFTDITGDKKQDCRVCQKEVYKMEEVKAEKSIYHKNCFRCNECEKQLKVDNYQSHEGVLYCKGHFKLLFSPKVVDDTSADKPRKPELIIRENQPLELPPDVVRASDKPDLGLEELQQINIRSKFEAFEKPEKEENNKLERTPSSAGVKRSASILSKLAKFQSKGLNADDDLNIIQASESDPEPSDDDDDADPDLVRAKRAQRERPVGLGNMNDIKTKFESGHIMSKEERREERKQEIQNIRSRLFMGKQARIKEMYQQAVAESEQGTTSVGKKSEIEIGDKARSLKEKFEKGEIFKEHDETAKVQDDELEVFESAISKKSRRLFKELDASASAKSQLSPRNRLKIEDQQNRSFEDQVDANSTNQSENIVKHDEKLDDVQVETSDISSKFKFFETYKPVTNEKKTFRITPPREGVVKLPTPESESDDEPVKQPFDTEPAEKTQTATIMLNKFREMEQSKNKVHLGPRPLKCFTPPPDDGNRICNESDSDMENLSEEEEYDDEGEEEEEDEYNGIHIDARSADHLEDEALKQAQNAARAKKLRAKFEKWEANEIQREIQEGSINLYGDDNAENNQIESAMAIRAKFENMKETQSNQSTRPRYKVNRFV